MTIRNKSVFHICDLDFTPNNRIESKLLRKVKNSLLCYVTNCMWFLYIIQ